MNLRFSRCLFLPSLFSGLILCISGIALGIFVGWLLNVERQAEFTQDFDSREGEILATKNSNGRQSLNVPDISGWLRIRPESRLATTMTFDASVTELLEARNHFSELLKNNSEKLEQVITEMSDLEVLLYVDIASSIDPKVTLKAIERIEDIYDIHGSPMPNLRTIALETWANVVVEQNEGETILAWINESKLERSQEASEMLGKCIGEHDPDSAWDLLLGGKVLLNDRRGISPLLDGLTKSRPKETINYLKSEIKYGYARPEWTSSFKHLATDDAHAAIELYNELPFGIAMSNAFKGLSSGLKSAHVDETNLSKLLLSAASLTDYDSSLGATQAIISAVARYDSNSAIDTVVKTLPHNSNRGDIITTIAESYGKLNVDDGIVWLDRLSESNPSEAALAGEAMAHTIISSDASEAHRLLETLSDSSTLSQAIGTVLKREADPVQ